MSSPMNPAAPQAVVIQPQSEKGQAMQMTPTEYGAQYGQPQQTTFMNLPAALNYLSSLDKVNINQVLHAVEVFLNFERNNEYNISNTADQQFLHVKEDTDCCTRQMLGVLRPFTININDMQGQTVLQCERGLRCQGCCCPCCLQEMDILIPGNQKIATIKELWSFMTPKYEIYDVTGNLMYRIQGDCCYCKCCADVPFKIYRPDGSDVGEITKHWNGCAEIWAGTNTFSVSFPMDEPVFNKAILLGATFLVDFMYFERNQ